MQFFPHGHWASGASELNEAFTSLVVWGWDPGKALESPSSAKFGRAFLCGIE